MPDLSDAGERFAELADSLLVGRPQASGASGGAGGTRSLAAWRAYERGHLALEAWDLVEARAAFLEAAREDPSYPHAHLALAHTTLWSGRPAADSRGPAARALAVRERLGAREVALAEALVALADGRYDEACRGYGDVVAIGSFSFAGWFGLGECHRLDRLIVRDRASPSGWSFRASAELGTHAYARALEIIPSSHQVFAGLAYDNLAELLYTVPETIRRGHTVDPDTSWFGAFPSLHGDTLALIPYPFDQLLARASDFQASSRQAADRNRNRLVQVTRSWVSAFPTSPTAHEALGRALESAGRITGRDPNSSALAAIARARELPAGRGDDRRLAIINVRLQVKVGEYAAARLLADSVLSRSERDNVRDSSLAALSALVGRVGNVPDLLSDGVVTRAVYSPRGERIMLPPPIAEAARKLLAYAAAGVHADSIEVLVATVHTLVEALMAPAHREIVTHRLLTIPQMLAYPFTGTIMLQDSAGNEHALLSVQRALARGDSADARARLGRLQQQRIGTPPSDLWIDHGYAEAWLLAAVGDTIGAERLLEQAIAGIAESGTLLYEFPHLPAAMVRAFGLRAELAAGRGDFSAAARWASAVVQLWRDADPALQPFVQRMYRLAN
jgi:eukaryotic-like serine/threonine-protein kinase